MISPDNRRELGDDTAELLGLNRENRDVGRSPIDSIEHFDTVFEADLADFTKSITGWEAWFREKLIPTADQAPAGMLLIPIFHLSTLI